MRSCERHTLSSGFCNEGGVLIPYLAAAIPEPYVDKHAPSQNSPKLETFLTYAVPSSGANQPFPLAEHLGRLVGKTSMRNFGKTVGLDNTTISKLLKAVKPENPALAMTASIAKDLSLSDEQIYRIIINAATVSVETDACRRVFSDDAPALEGSIGKQFKGYRLARGFSQRLLADRANVAHASVSRLESGKRVPSFVSLARLASVLGLNTRQVRGALRAVVIRETK
jgi:transcriptional regulator with XRE-family HTH domain